MVNGRKSSTASLIGAPMSEQYICTIESLNKVVNRKEILKDIWLSFYPGAKIGVIGGNGAGKSTLIPPRISASGMCRRNPASMSPPM
jgi:ABC-type polysaccharide/polyol phosphate transport system ATPase subunit